MSAEKKIDNGGAAFPYGQKNVTQEYSVGLSMRDYFAAASLPLAYANWEKHNDDNNDGESPIASLVADEAYEIADAMIAARKTIP